ncbi:hypothetical protein OF83DRAFT_1151445 [Amylostereum chailletii]|nr:hypothetical protein OF83DRAFT_1151445 [Amylostereum chailletii]
MRRKEAGTGEGGVFGGLPVFTCESAMRRRTTRGAEARHHRGVDAKPCHGDEEFGPLRILILR